jgi:hypothetical protein
MIQSNITRNATIHDAEGAGRQSTTREYTDVLRYFPFDVNDTFFQIFGRGPAESQKLFKEAKKGFMTSLFNELKFQRWCFILSSEEGVLARQTDSSQWADSTIPEITIEISTRFCNINALVYKGSRCYINSFLLNPYLVSQGLGTKTYQYFEYHMIKKYQVKQFCLQPLVRSATSTRPPENAGVFWTKMGFKYPDGPDVLKLNPNSRKGEPPERVQISQAQLNIVNQNFSGNAPHAIEKSYNKNPGPGQSLFQDRIWMAEDMWKDVSSVPSFPPSLPDEMQRELDLSSMRSVRPQPAIFFDFDDASQTKLSRRTVDKLSYDRTSDASLVGLLRRSYIALCNPMAAPTRKQGAPGRPPLTTQRARVPTVRYRDKTPQPTRNVRQRTQAPQPVVDVLDVLPVLPQVKPATVLPPRQIQNMPPAAVLKAPQDQKTQQDYDEHKQMFNDFLAKPLTEKQRKEHQQLFNEFLQKP